MVGLGLALAQPRRRVLVMTGDGEMLMGLGSLATIGVQRPANLAVVVIDNGLYAETGMQRDAHRERRGSGGGRAVVRLRARGDGAARKSELDALAGRLLRRRGPLFAAVKVSPDATKIELAPRDGTSLRGRFREALLGPDPRP